MLGIVALVDQYGAFLEFGGATGVLDITQISHLPFDDINKILNEGDELKVSQC